MKCHEDNKGEQGSHQHSPLKHMLILFSVADYR